MLIETMRTCFNGLASFMAFSGLRTGNGLFHPLRPPTVGSPYVGVL